MKNNTYLLLGPEEGEKSDFIKKLIKQKQQELREKPEIYRYYPFEANMLDIVTLLKSGSLFCNFKFVIISNIESLTKAAELDLLIEYCQNPAEDACLILTGSEVYLSAKKLAAAIPPQNKVIFWELNETRKRGWVMNFFRQRDLKPDAAAVAYLLEMVENNTRDLKNECTKLAGFFAPGSKITEDDLEKYLYHSKQENVFTLFEKIAARNFPVALEILNKLELAGEANAIALLSGLLWQFRKVLQIKRLSEKNYQIAEINKAAGITSKKSQRIFTEAHKNYSKTEITAAIILITDFDVKFRSFRQEMHNLLLRMFLYYLVVGGGQVRLPEKDRYL